MEKIFKFNSILEAMNFSIRNSDKNATSWLHSVDGWTDYYGMQEFYDDFMGFKNKNKNSKQEKLNLSISLLKKNMDKVAHHFLNSNTFEQIFCCHGSSVDMGRYLSGDPDCMIEFDSPNKMQRTNIFYNIAAPGMWSTALDNLGIFAYALITLLKRRSFNFYGYVNISNQMYILIPIVIAGKDIILPNVEIALLNSLAFFRRIIFGIMESADSSLRDQLGIYPQGGYGQCGEISKEIIKQKFNINADVLIDRELRNCFEGGDYEEIASKLVQELIVKPKN